MAAGVYDTEMEQGADWRRQFVYLDSAGAPIDISGATIVMKAKASALDAAALVEASVGNGKIELTTPASGIFTVIIPAAATGAIPVPDGKFRKLIYDILVTIPAGTYRILRGTLTVTAGISQ